MKSGHDLMNEWLKNHLEEVSDEEIKKYNELYEKLVELGIIRGKK